LEDSIAEAQCEESQIVFPDRGCAKRRFEAMSSRVYPSKRLIMPKMPLIATEITQTYQIFQLTSLEGAYFGSLGTLFVGRVAVVSLAEFRRISSLASSSSDRRWLASKLIGCDIAASMYFFWT
jgi:hypothetical protein